MGADFLFCSLGGVWATEFSDRRASGGVAISDLVCDGAYAWNQDLTRVRWVEG